LTLRLLRLHLLRLPLELLVVLVLLRGPRVLTLGLVLYGLTRRLRLPRLLELLLRGVWRGGLTVQLLVRQRFLHRRHRLSCNHKRAWTGRAGSLGERRLGHCLLLLCKVSQATLNKADKLGADTWCVETEVGHDGLVDAEEQVAPKLALGVRKVETPRVRLVPGVLLRTTIEPERIVEGNKPAQHDTDWGWRLLCCKVVRWRLGHNERPARVAQAALNSHQRPTDAADCLHQVRLVNDLDTLGEHGVHLRDVGHR
jgi:hypothetical protein